jgi:hypothetical protein
MAGLDPATQNSRGSAMENPLLHQATKKPKGFRVRTAVRQLGGRVKPGHDEFICAGGVVHATAFNDSSNIESPSSKILSSTVIGTRMRTPLP